MYIAAYKIIDQSFEKVPRARDGSQMTAIARGYEL